MGPLTPWDNKRGPRGVFVSVPVSLACERKGLTDVLWSVSVDVKERSLKKCNERNRWTKSEPATVELHHLVSEQRHHHLLQHLNVFPERTCCWSMSTSPEYGTCNLQPWSHLLARLVSINVETLKCNSIKLWAVKKKQENNLSSCFSRQIEHLWSPDIWEEHWEVSCAVVFLDSVWCASVGGQKRTGPIKVVVPSRHRTSWRNGSASDSRSEGCVFKSRRGHFFDFIIVWNERFDDQLITWTEIIKCRNCHLLTRLAAKLL